jgi:glutamyl/glutaminyl-tRNA synthetase
MKGEKALSGASHLCSLVVAVITPSSSYVGRLAPSPTGYLHLGHARTFWIAAARARAVGGMLLLRNDDLDRARCRPEFVAAMQEDLLWLGLTWDGAMIAQSARLDRYRAALERLHAAGLIFPCMRSRRDVLEAASAPHGETMTPPPAAGSGDNHAAWRSSETSSPEGAANPPPAEDDEPVYPKAFRPSPGARLPPLGNTVTTNWRFRVPDGEAIEFDDGACGPQRAIAGRDFGDFIVWRKDDTPSYQLATVVDDAELGVTEVVRGADLIKSTFRQLLLLRALGWPAPGFLHAPLMLDERGHRLAKRSDALAVRTLRQQGATPESILAKFAADLGAPEKG